MYLNHNVTLNQLKEVVQKNINHKIDYMSDDFNDAQKNALELFKKRIYLEEVIEETIAFNKKLTWDNSNPNLKLTTTAEDLIEVFKLRSDVYTEISNLHKEINYKDQYKDEIEGLNFDKYDKNSAVLYYKNSDKITGTTRIIFDSKSKLPVEKKFSFDYIREKDNRIAELSRLAVKQKKGLNLEFKNLFQGIYHIIVNNNIDIAIAVILKDYFKLYTKFGGIQVEKEVDSYGTIDTSNLVVSWNPYIASKFFKKSFLS